MWTIVRIAVLIRLLGPVVYCRARQTYLRRLKLLQRAWTKYFPPDMEHRFCQAMVYVELTVSASPAFYLLYGHLNLLP